MTGGNKRGGIREILQHDYKDVPHLQSIAAIPQIIENAVFIDELPNDDIVKYAGVKSFRYYVCGLKIGGENYTVKAVVAVQSNGSRYYDHKLSEIEKGELLSIIPTIQKAGIENNLPSSVGKDKRLFSILQTNSSKIVDENGEPKVVTHITDSDFYVFDNIKFGENTDDNASDENWAKTAHVGFWFNDQIKRNKWQNREVKAFLNIKEPYRLESIQSLADELDGITPEGYIDYFNDKGYDGIIVSDEEFGGTSLVALTNTQIKSVTENIGTFDPNNADIRYSRANAEIEVFNEKINNANRDANEDINKVNDRFNEELGRLIEENKDKIILSLGSPSAVLLSAGIDNKPMKLYGNKVIKKMKKHGFTLEELKDLPRAVADPIAVFDNYQLDGNRTILTELQSQGKNIMVAVTLGKDGVDVDFNIVSSVFGKGEDNIVDWLNKGYARYINKEKALNYLHHSDRHISEALSNPRLVSAAKVVQNFENPSVDEEKNSPNRITLRKQMAERVKELEERLII